MIARGLLWGLVPLALLASACGGDDVATAIASERELTIEAEVTGRIYARSSADVSPPALGRKVWDFRLSSLVEEGREVEEGDKLLSFDTGQLEERLLQEIADRDSSKQSLEKKKIDLALERETETLALAEAESNRRRFGLQADVPEDVISARELDLVRLDLELSEREVAHRKQLIESLDRRADSEIKSLEARLARQELDVRQLEQLIERMTVYAPRSGTVVYRQNWQGEKKKVGDSVWRMETILEIPDLSTLAATVFVDEAQAGRVAVGQSATLRLDAHPDREYRATVASIQRTVQRRSWRDPRKVVALELELAEIDRERMRPGMRLTGSVHIEQRPAAIAVPTDAVTQTPEGPAALVRTRFGSERRQLVLGVTVGGYTEVVEGMSAGERVVLRPTLEGQS